MSSDNLDSKKYEYWSNFLAENEKIYYYYLNKNLILASQ